MMAATQIDQLFSDWLESKKSSRKLAITLSDLYKYSTNRFGEQTTSIQMELEMIMLYLEIEKIRIDERLKYSILVDSDVQETEA